MRKSIWPALLLALGGAAAARASDQTGGYIVVDRVVLEPNAEAPTRAQVWGTFALARGKAGDTYEAPVHGYLYYSAVKGKEDVCRREWKDLQKVAGKGQVVGFGSRYNVKGMGRVRKSGEEPKSPDPYPLGNGLAWIRPSLDYSPVRELITIPVPLGPADDGTVAAGRVTLVARNIVDKRRPDAKYHFEIEDASGEKEVSPAVEPGDKRTKWSPKMKVVPGGKYAWRVWAADDSWTGPVAKSSFRGKKGS